MSRNTELKPCPFCGGEATLEQNNSTKKWWVCCSNPKCRINPSTDMHITRAVIVREWNRRADNVVERKKGEWVNGDFITYYLDGKKYTTAYCFRCSECGKEVGKKENYCPNCGTEMSTKHNN